MDRNKEGWFLRLIHLDLTLLLGCWHGVGHGAGRVVQRRPARSGSGVGQAMRLGLGFAIMLTLAQIPPHYFRLLVAMDLSGRHPAVAGGDGGRRYLQGRAALAGFGRAAVSALGDHEAGRADDDGWLLRQQTLPPRCGTCWAGRRSPRCRFILIAKQPDLGTALVVGLPGRSRCFWPG
jgi:rod shape determining protein RodA